MTYSVFIWNTGRYKYYKAPGDLPGARPAPPRKVGDPNGRGRWLESLLSTVPNGAVPIGEGQEAIGRIALLPGQLERDVAVGAPSSAASLTGFGADDATPAPVAKHYNAVPTSPLILHPWRTLGLWLAATYVAMELSFYIGRQVEASLRRKTAA